MSALFIYPGSDYYGRDIEVYGMTKGTGFIVKKCSGADTRPVFGEIEAQLRNSGVLVGGNGYLYVGIHTVIPQIRDPKRHGYMIPGRPVDWACVERVSDGLHFDLPFKEFFNCWQQEPLNAMEVLARVEKERG
jgi:hypothetical protein